MAQALVLFCDVHLYEHGEQVDAQTYTWHGVEFDLCDACLELPIRLLDTIADDYGRKPNGQKPTKRAKKSAALAAAEQRAMPDVIDVTCSLCGKVASSGRGLKMHMARTHKGS